LAVSQHLSFGSCQRITIGCCPAGHSQKLKAGNAVTVGSGPLGKSWNLPTMENAVSFPAEKNVVKSWHLTISQQTKIRVSRMKEHWR